MMCCYFPVNANFLLQTQKFSPSKVFPYMVYYYFVWPCTSTLQSVWSSSSRALLLSINVVDGSCGITDSYLLVKIISSIYVYNVDLFVDALQCPTGKVVNK